VKKFVLIIPFFFFVILKGNDVDSTLNKWEPSLVFSLNLSQVAFYNWNKGGKNSYAYELGVNWKMHYNSTRWVFENKFWAIIGHSRLENDEINITSNYLHNETVLLGTGFLFHPYMSNLIRTALIDGYDYKKSPNEQIVAFFDPGYISQSIGLAYENESVIKVRLGFAFEESFADKFATKYTDVPTSAEVEKFKLETGIESMTDINYDVAQNIKYKGKLRLFSGFERLKIWDVAFNNYLIAKVNDWLNVNFSYVLIYKASESLKTQMKEGLQIGVSYSVF
jgi:hypothetical protein